MSRNFSPQRVSPFTLPPSSYVDRDLKSPSSKRALNGTIVNRTNLPSPKLVGKPKSVKTQIIYGDGGRKKYPNELVVIFCDWDDTLFPTTYMTHYKYTEKTFKELPPDVQNELRTLEDNVIRFIRELKEWGEFYILTNATAGWINKSCSMYFPRLYSNVLNTIPIISARDQFKDHISSGGKLDAGTDRDDPKEWKYFSMRKMLDKIHVECDKNQKECFMVSIGDSMFEANASTEIKYQIGTSGFNHTLNDVFTIKFAEYPNILGIRYQLQEIEKEFGHAIKICSEHGQILTFYMDKNLIVDA